MYLKGESALSTEERITLAKPRQWASNCLHTFLALLSILAPKNRQSFKFFSKSIKEISTEARSQGSYGLYTFSLLPFYVHIGWLEYFM